MNDFGNGLFELGGALMCALHVRRILRDRCWRGMSWLPFAFFAAWGWWNLYFYPSVGCWWSFAGGVLLVLVNTFYCYLLWRYRNQ